MRLSAVQQTKELQHMPADKTVTTPARPVKPYVSAADRRAARIVADSTKQAELKAEAAERRQARALRDAKAV
jgi:hypothetical protein